MNLHKSTIIFLVIRFKFLLSIGCVIMDLQIYMVIFLNSIIAFIGTMAYSVRLVGIRTGKIALSFAIFNVFSLISRTAVTFQAPILTKYIEQNTESAILLNIFMLIILVSGISTIFGAFMIPSFQRFLTKCVQSFSLHRSIPKILLYSFSKIGISHIKEFMVVPVKENITKIPVKTLPKKTIILNIVAVSIITAGSLAPIYAGCIEPDLRATCLTLSSVINGIAAILLAVFIDPQLSIMTDEVIEKKRSEQEFRACVVGMVCSKTIGTFLSLLIFLPTTYFVVFIAKAI